MRIPVLYIRVSSQRQVLEGGGMDDQLTAGSAYIKGKPDLDLSRLQVIRDEGISSYKGANLMDGMPLKDFVDARVAAGDGDKYALVVISVDRISRMNPWASSQFIGTTIMTGMHIHDISSGQVLKQDDHIGAIISTLNLMRANNESAVKSERRLLSIESALAHSLQTGEALKGKLPKWIRIEDKKYVVDWSIAGLIVEAVDLYLAGQTSGQIVKYFNNNGKLFGKTIWSSQVLLKIMRNKNITGTYSRVKDGQVEEYENFYPQIVSPEKYKQLKELISAMGKHITKHRVDKGRVTNLFSGFMVCHDCGGVMSVNRHTSTLKYFDCANARRRRTCDAKKGNYITVERAVLSHVKGLDLSVLLSTKQQDHSHIDTEILEVQNHISSLEQSMKKRKEAGKLVPVEMLDSLGDSRERLLELRQSLPPVNLVSSIEIGDVEEVLDDMHPRRGLIHRSLSDIVQKIGVVRNGRFVLIFITYKRIDDIHVLITDNSTGQVYTAISQSDDVVELYGMEGSDKITGKFLESLPNGYMRFERKIKAS